MRFSSVQMLICSMNTTDSNRSTAIPTRALCLTIIARHNCWHQLFIHYHRHGSLILLLFIFVLLLLILPTLYAIQHIGLLSSNSYQLPNYNLCTYNNASYKDTFMSFDGVNDAVTFSNDIAFNEKNEVVQESLRKLKNIFDPDNILNRGELIF